MRLTIQQPGSASLLDAINTAASTADSGGGVFAFATRGGIEDLLNAPHIRRMLRARRQFHLVVGVDSITNAEALLFLEEKMNEYHGTFVAEVFYHEYPNSTFHPKFSWFSQSTDLCLVLGSGNLTRRGIGEISATIPAPGNWEAFTTQVLEGADATHAGKMISDWLELHRANGMIVPVDDVRVRQKAMENGRTRFKTRKVRPAIPGATSHLIVAADDVDLGSHEVLVREIPRNRTGQADVGKDALTEFFGYEGVAKDIFIQHVSLSDEVGPAEQIRLFVNASRNYRLELHAIADLTYQIAADDSRMVLVATKLDHRSFRYTIVPVTSPEHAFLMAVLGPLVGRRRLMRERRMTANELQAAWPGIPNNLLPVVSPIPET